MNAKYVGLCLFLSVLLSGCGQSAPSDNNDIVFSADEETISVQQVEKEEVQTLQRNGIEMKVPENFQDENAYGYAIYSKMVGDTPLYLSYIAYNTVSESELETIQNDELPDFFHELLLYDVNQCYDVSSGEFQMNAEYEEETTVMGNAVKVVAGHMYVNEEYPALYYKAYYAMLPLQLYEGAKFPTCWIAFGEDTDSIRLESDEALNVFAGEAIEY